MDPIINLITQFNWIDIVVVAIFIRIVYTSYKNGIWAELFRFFGIIVAIYLSLHYYSSWAKGICDKLNYPDVQIKFFELFTFALPALLAYISFYIFRTASSKFVNVEFIPKLSSWGGVIVGILRGFFSISLFLYFLLIPASEYFTKSVKTSFLGQKLIVIAPTTYSGLWDSIMSKFMTSEKLNKTVFELIK